ncbi:acyl-CoA ligase (AMP-forming), exosortase A system-associated [Microbacterium sp. SLBN-146]|uniref:acyl-CoA ligase (AMP-forming), exosortase A system-associated n=1 Tax=Microbacterium sp. SLBN-146 TaxID=2768457 RepID=UPI00114DB5D2|nr:acyl-CoA ligase (AMP-forming), exosortase A system-associated [Microbacterium sp. SLBN-146]TQJ30596.1 acyl-CoA ligase (AMP-forming) (exosortase A-associated) [Microbacterium sp. SLBN-146]
MPASTIVALHELLDASAIAAPDRPALTYKDVTLTYAQTRAAAVAAAAQFAELGVARGDRIAIYLEKRLETVVAMFGASLVGGMFVPINHVFKATQVGHVLEDSGARVLVTSADRLSQLERILPGTDVTDVILVGDAPVPAASDVRTQPWSDASPTAALPSVPTIDLDPAAILYTSGSTGRPKGVVLSHRNLIVGAQSVSSYLGNTADDVILSVLPLSFDAGLSQVTTSFAVGAHCVLMNYLLPREVAKMCAKHGVTGITCVPPLWLQLADIPWPEKVAANIRYWANTGGRMPRSTLDRLRENFPHAQPFLMYGLTEAFRSTYLEPDQVDARPDSIGKAIPNAEVLVLRPDGSECGPGEDGELVHRGALVALGYWNDPERTAERFRLIPRPDQPWRTPEMAVWSGDTVRRDEDGYLYFVGRRDEMIKTSGYRVSPTEIEEAAFATGLVRDVVAFGIEDASIGQRIVLVASPTGETLDVDGLVGLLRKSLPLYMVPSHVSARADLPRSPNGKYDRKMIRSEWSA